MRDITLNWRLELKHTAAMLIQRQRMNILTWQLRRRKNIPGLLDLLRVNAEKQSARVKKLHSQGISYDDCYDDWFVINLMSVRDNIHRHLENLVPDSIEPMLHVLNTEELDSVLVEDMIFLFGELKEPKAIPRILEFLTAEDEPEEIADLLWSVGKIAGYTEREKSYLVGQYLQTMGSGYSIQRFQHLLDETKEAKIEEMRSIIIPYIIPYLLHSHDEVKTNAYIALRRILPDDSDHILKDFQRNNPEIELEEIYNQTKL